MGKYSLKRFSIFDSLFRKSKEKAQAESKFKYSNDEVFLRKIKEIKPGLRITPYIKSHLLLQAEDTIYPFGVSDKDLGTVILSRNEIIEFNKEFTWVPDDILIVAYDYSNKSFITVDSNDVLVKWKSKTSNGMVSFTPEGFLKKDFWQ